MSLSDIVSSAAPFLDGFPFARAAAAVGAAALYLNGRYNVAADLSLSKKFIWAGLTMKMREMADRVNLFYQLEQHAKTAASANRPFLVYGGQSWSYMQTYNIVLQYAAWLRSQGVRPGHIVALDCHNCDTFVWVWLAIWSVGARAAFINYNLADESLLHCVRTADARLLLVHPEVYQQVFTARVCEQLGRADFLDSQDGRDRSVAVVVLDDPLRAQIEDPAKTAPFRAPDVDRAGQELTAMAMLIYTSGTTGLPKPGMVSWSKVLIGSAFVSMWLQMQTDDIFYTCMPLYHGSAALLGLCVCLQAGSTLSLGHSFHRSTFWEDVRSSNATMIQYVGETCRYLMSAPPSPLDRKHKVRLAFGNGLRSDVWEPFKQRFGIETIAEFYGSTEGPLALFNFSRNGLTSGAVGKGGPLARIILGRQSVIAAFDMDNDCVWRDPDTGFGAIVQTNEPGEILSRLDPANITEKFQGYYKDKSATKKKILRDVFTKGDAWFSTGDIMRVTADGLYFFCDRIGDTFRWKSENVSTTEVADVLGRHPDVSEAIVYGVELPNHDGRAGCAAVLLREEIRDEAAALAGLATHAIGSLPRYAVPLFVRLTSTAEMERRRTGTNKQQKAGLRAEGADPAKVAGSGSDRLFWLPPGAGRYEPFGAHEWERLEGNSVRL